MSVKIGVVRVGVHDPDTGKLMWPELQMRYERGREGYGYFFPRGNLEPFITGYRNSHPTGDLPHGHYKYLHPFSADTEEKVKDSLKEAARGCVKILSTDPVKLIIYDLSYYAEPEGRDISKGTIPMGHTDRDHNGYVHLSWGLFETRKVGDQGQIRFFGVEKWSPDHNRGGSRIPWSVDTEKFFVQFSGNLNTLVYTIDKFLGGVHPEALSEFISSGVALLSSGPDA